MLLSAKYSAVLAAVSAFLSTSLAADVAQLYNSKAKEIQHGRRDINDPVCFSLEEPLDRVRFEPAIDFQKCLVAYKGPGCHKIEAWQTFTKVPQENSLFQIDGVVANASSFTWMDGACHPLSPTTAVDLEAEKANVVATLNLARDNKGRARASYKVALDMVGGGKHTKEGKRRLKDAENDFKQALKENDSRWEEMQKKLREMSAEAEEVMKNEITHKEATNKLLASGLHVVAQKYNYPPFEHTPEYEDFEYRRYVEAQPYMDEMSRNAAEIERIKKQIEDHKKQYELQEKFWAAEEKCNPWEFPNNCERKKAVPFEA